MSKNHVMHENFFTDIAKKPENSRFPDNRRPKKCLFILSRKHFLQKCKETSNIYRIVAPFSPETTGRQRAPVPRKINTITK